MDTHDLGDLKLYGRIISNFPTRQNMKLRSCRTALNTI